jgi:preprotein translocase subunit YajC
MELILLGFAAILVVFMFFSSRKRKREQQVLQDKMVPGAEIMTSFGVFGTLISVDDETHTAVVEVAPGVELKVYRQTLARVVEPTVAEDEDATEDVVAEDAAIEERPVAAEPVIDFDAKPEADQAEVKRKDAE